MKKIKLLLLCLLPFMAFAQTPYKLKFDTVEIVNNLKLTHYGAGLVQVDGSGRVSTVSVTGLPYVPTTLPGDTHILSAGHWLQVDSLKMITGVSTSKQTGASYNIKNSTTGIGYSFTSGHIITYLSDTSQHLYNIVVRTDSTDIDGTPVAFRSGLYSYKPPNSPYSVWRVKDTASVLATQSYVNIHFTGGYGINITGSAIKVDTAGTSNPASKDWVKAFSYSKSQASSVYAALLSNNTLAGNNTFTGTNIFNNSGAASTSFTTTAGAGYGQIVIGASAPAVQLQSKNTTSNAYSALNLGVDGSNLPFFKLEASNGTIGGNKLQRIVSKNGAYGPGMGIGVQDAVDLVGFLYNADYSAAGASNNRWIPDIGYINSHFAPAAGGGYAPTFTVTSPITYSSNIIGIQTASGSQNGALSSSDWTTFNNKQNAITLGTTSQYLKGDLSLGTFPTAVSSFTNDVGYTTASSTTTFTNKDLTSGTNTFPTFNQNTTGSAAKFTTARTINGTSFDGTANITITANTPNNFTLGYGFTATSNFNGGSAITATIDTSKLATVYSVKDSLKAHAATIGYGLLFNSGTNTLSADTGAHLVDKTYLTAYAYTKNQITSNSFNYTGTETYLANGIGSTPTDRLILSNTTAAANGAQQYSSAIDWTGYAWSIGSSASQNVAARAYLIPVQGSSVSANLAIDFSLNGGAFGTKFLLSSAGGLTLNGGGGSLNLGLITSAVSSFATTTTVGYSLSNNAAATSGIPVQYSPFMSLGARWWNTSGTPASNRADIGWELRPTSGSTAAYKMVWMGKTQTGTSVPTSWDADLMSLDNFGNLTLVGGSLRIGSTQSTVSGSTSGNAVFAQPNQGTGWKQVVIYLNALVGTASYTYPTAFTQTPVVLSSSGLATAKATSVSTTAVTVTGATDTGILILAGY